MTIKSENRKSADEGYVLPRCCVNYYRDGGICKECPDGYLGVNCSNVCPLPLYGKLCQSRCECTKERIKAITFLFYWILKQHKYLYRQRCIAKDDNKNLPSVYWIPKINKGPYIQRYIAGCSHITGCNIQGHQTSTESEFVISTMTTSEQGRLSSLVPEATNPRDTSTEDTHSTESIQKENEKGNGKESNQVFHHLLMYGLPCVVPAVIIIFGSWMIRRKCAITKKVNLVDDATNIRLSGMDDGYETIDDSLIIANITIQQVSGNNTTFSSSVISVENGDTVSNDYLEIIPDNDYLSSGSGNSAGNDVPVVSSNDYLEIIPDNDNLSSGSDISAGNDVPAVSSNVYLHPYNPLLPDWKSHTPLYNDEEPEIKNDGYLNPYQPLEENWLQRTHVYNTATKQTTSDVELPADKYTSSDVELPADQLNIEQTSKENVTNDEAAEINIEEISSGTPQKIRRTSIVHISNDDESIDQNEQEDEDYDDVEYDV